MIKSQYFLTLLILSFISCTGQTKWKIYSDEKGKFKTEFLGKPTVTSESEQMQFANLTWTIASVEKANGSNLSYLVKYADIPSEIVTSDSLRLLQDLFLFTQMDLGEGLGDNGLENIYTKQIQKYPGREFRWKDVLDNIGYTRRVFLVKNRLYFLEVTYDLENDFNNDIEGFLDKFTLLNTKDNPNPEILPEKPVKKFEATFPGKTKTVETPGLHELFGNTFAMSEVYETPSNLVNLPTTNNLLYGVNYMKFPADSMEVLTTTQLRDFVTKTLRSFIEAKLNGEILYQNEISLDGNWGIEGQGRVINGNAVIHVRAYIVDDYYYQVLVMSKNKTQNNQEALDFLNSFKLKN